MFELPKDWSWETVERIAATEKYACVGGPFGSKLSQKHYVESGVPVIRGKNLSSSEGFFLDDEFVFVSEEKAKTLKSNMAYPGDLVFTQRGTLGQVGWIPKAAQYPAYVVSQSQMKLKVNSELVDPGFVFSYFRSPWALGYIHRNAITTGVPHTNLTILRGFPIPVPPLDEQRRIANVLGALDDKIELNRKMNRTLEEMAQAIFKSWFIDFDGVDASEMVESELGPIPKGWEVKPLLECVELLSGGTPKTSREDFWGGKVKWASAKDVSQCKNRYLIDTERTITEAGLSGSSTKIIPAGAVVVVARGATCGRWCIFGEAVAMNQTCYALVARNVEHSEFAKHQVPAVLNTLVQQAHGSVFDTITTRTFKTAQVVQPPNQIIANFSTAIRHIEERLLKSVYESRTLAELRDALLPKLISGELRVPEAEAAVEAAL